MAKVEKSIELNVPVHTAYNQWTQFEQFPQFMDGVKEVRQLDDKRLHWKADIGGKVKEWDAEIAEQTPDRRIAWHSISGTRNAGQVSFQQIDANRTRITLLMDYEPEGVVEKAGDAMGVVSGKVQGDLERFKEFIESRGRESGAWRGEIHGGQVRQSGQSGAAGPGSDTGVGGTSTGADRPGGVDSGFRPTDTPGSSSGRSGALRVDPGDKDDDINPGPPRRKR